MPLYQLKKIAPTISMEFRNGEMGKAGYRHILDLHPTEALPELHWNDISKDIIPCDGIMTMISAGCASAFFYDHPINLIVVAISMYLAANWVFFRSLDIFAWRGAGARFRRLQQKSDMSRETLIAVLRERERPAVLVYMR